MALYHTVILQAEGAIEGEADMYEVASPYETTFAFSRFDAAERKFTPDERLAAAEASATDRELPERRLSERRLSSGVWLSCAFSPPPPSPATPCPGCESMTVGCDGSRITGEDSHGDVALGAEGCCAQAKAKSGSCGYEVRAQEDPGSHPPLNQVLCIRRVRCSGPPAESSSARRAK